MVIGILVMLALSLAFVLLFNYSKKKIMTEQMLNQQLAYEHQEKLLHSTILTQEEERKRIARELHDEIGSKLNVILLNIHRLQEPTFQAASQMDITTEMSGLIHTAIDTTRRISHDLLPPTLEDFGLVEAIKELQHNYNASGAVEISFDLAANELQIEDKIIELNLFRVLQELIINSIKHGNATEINVELWLQKDLVKLSYQDNGVGFDMAGFNNKKGLGMKNIESRLRMIKAEQQFASSPGKGMSALVQLISSRT